MIINQKPDYLVRRDAIPLVDGLHADYSDRLYVSM